MRRSTGNFFSIQHILRVQQLNDRIELLGFSPRGLQILRVLGTPDCTASDAAKIVGCSKSLVSHWKDPAIKVTSSIFDYNQAPLSRKNIGLCVVIIGATVTLVLLNYNII
jgi:hypothetical protein